MEFLIYLLASFWVGVQAECDSRNWTQCRVEFTEAIFSLPSSALPSKIQPDFIELWDDYKMSGFPGPGQGTGVGNVSWSNGLQRLIWTLEGKMITLNATVLYSGNTSGNAPKNYPPPPRTPGCPNSSYPDYDSYKQRGDTIVLYHNGHETDQCIPNYDGVVDYLNELGYDVMELMMPLLGCNQAPQYGTPTSHAWFQQWQDLGENTMRFFIEPVILAINYAKSLGYKHVVMVGLSGGGWTTTVAAAVDTRIELSVPIAGSVPKFHTSYYPFWVPDLPEGAGKGEGGGGDYEQNMSQPMYASCDFVCMYVLAALEVSRNQLQILHQHDDCCFRAFDLHEELKAYNSFVQSQPIKGWMQTMASAGNIHEVNPRDKTVVAMLVEKLRRKEILQSDDFKELPFDLLQIS